MSMGSDQLGRIMTAGAKQVTAIDASIPTGWEGSRFAQRIRRRYEQERPYLPEGPLDRAALEMLLQTLSAREAALDKNPSESLGCALRITRQLVVERLLEGDTAQALSLAKVTQCMTDLAELALDAAHRTAVAELQPRYGTPQTAQGLPCALCIVGMGKFGARELNVSSDIDLIYVYDSDGETTGAANGSGRISNQEYFGKLVKVLYVLIGEPTEHGFVFRLDLALRPNGNSGPPAISLSALEDYFQVQGREWERFAWLKSRVVAPQSSIGSDCAVQLRGLVSPFVFRRYLDYSVLDALRLLHRQIRDHAAKRSAGQPGHRYDVKLSRGGIREIEFTVQVIQVVRGGQFPELRTRPTLSALQRLAKAGLMPEQTAQALAQAYTFLRQVEHRVQYLDDQQTHVLPHNETDLLWVAQTLGFEHTASFLIALDTHRELVAQEFDVLLGGSQAESESGSGSCGSGNGNEGATNNTLVDFDSLLQSLADQPPSAGNQPDADLLRARLVLWQKSPRVAGMPEASLGRLLRLLARTVQRFKAGEANLAACLGFLDWLESIVRRDSYLALLLERPLVHDRLLRLLGAARWPAKYAIKHPGVIDELASGNMLNERFDRAAFEQELEQRYLVLAKTGGDDEESLLNLLRRAHHAEVFRTLARDVEGRITVEQVADDLSALAESMLALCTRWCWLRLKTRHRPEPHIAIIAYGKLGGKELGYGSDLDIVFVYDDAQEGVGEIYGTFVRKLINWLTVKTGEGDLYEIDTALRPNGNAGLLVSSFDAFASYQEQRGSNTAWTWEHQAITRARCVLGSLALAQRFDSVRQAVITDQRDAAKLRTEIMAMRERVRMAHPVTAGYFDVKHSAGGMVDLEFAVQYMVLLHSAHHAALCANSGNIALLLACETARLVPEGCGQAAADTYRALRQIQHTARLNEAPTQLPTHAAQAEQTAGLALWTAVFAPEGGM